MKPPVEAPTSRQSSPATSRSERVERVLELDPAARDDTAAARLRIELGVLGDSCPGLVALGPSRPIRTRPARTDSRRARARAGEPALGEQGVDAALRHARTVPLGLRHSI